MWRLSRGHQSPAPNISHLWGAGESTKGLSKKPFSMASEGESCSFYSQDRFRALLADQTFDMSIGEVSVARVTAETMLWGG